MLVIKIWISVETDYLYHIHVKDFPFYQTSCKFLPKWQVSKNPKAPDYVNTKAFVKQRNLAKPLPKYACLPISWINKRAKSLHCKLPLLVPSEYIIYMYHPALSFIVFLFWFTVPLNLKSHFPLLYTWRYLVAGQKRLVTEAELT